MSGFPFLGYTFEPLKLEHQPELEAILKRYPNRISGYTFGSLMAWNAIFNYAWTFCSTKTLLICHREESSTNYHLMQPEGLFGIPCQQKILEHARTLPYALEIVGVSAPFILLHYPFYKHFKDCTVRKMANYLYRADDLATLEGRRYAKKRNLIHQAEQAYQWTSKPITDETVKDCRAVLEEIAQTEPFERTQLHLDELTAIEYALAHFSQLKQRGCLIYVDGHPAAFSIYEELAPDTCVIHFEKAIKRFKGLYQLINREAARDIAQTDYTYINREEDMGNEGLRQAKLSYYPAELVPFHILRFRQ
jgi:hypothetical protein